MATTDDKAEAKAGKTVKVRWTGNDNSGFKHTRTLGKHEWASDGWDNSPEVDVDAAWWAAITPAQRKAEGFEEVT